MCGESLISNSSITQFILKLSPSLQSKLMSVQHKLMYFQSFYSRWSTISVIRVKMMRLLRLSQSQWMMLHCFYWIITFFHHLQKIYFISDFEDTFILDCSILLILLPCHTALPSDFTYWSILSITSLVRQH